jgi:carbon monoxide dehydrogenase subunit G
VKLTHSVQLAADPTAVFAATLEALNSSEDLRATVGPLRVAYHGTIRRLEVDYSLRTATFRAFGVEQAGQGDADAYLMVRVDPDELGSVVTINTELTVRGKVAEFGAGHVRKIGDDLFESFVHSVEENLAKPAPEPVHAARRWPIPVSLAGIGLVVGFIAWRFLRNRTSG